MPPGFHLIDFGTVNDLNPDVFIVDVRIGQSAQVRNYAGVGRIGTCRFRDGYRHQYHVGVVRVVGRGVERIVGVQNMVGVIFENVHDVVLQPGECVTVRGRIVGGIEIVLVVVDQPVGKKLGVGTFTQEKVDAAKTALDAMTQEEIDAATQTLREARLRARTKADKSALDELIETANAMTLGGYGRAQVLAFRQALV